MRSFFGLMVGLLALTTPLATVSAAPYEAPAYAGNDLLAVRLSRHVFANAPKPPSSTPMGRCNAISFIAINDAMNSIHGINENALVSVPVRGRDKTASVRGAMLGAFSESRSECMKRLPHQYKADTLLFTDVDLVPYQEALQTMIAQERATLETNENVQDVAKGFDIGVQAARMVLVSREDDGYKVPAPVQDYECGVEGKWCSWTEKTKPADARGAGYPNWGSVKPFSFDHVSEFTVPAPPKVGSFLHDFSVNQTRAVGKAGFELVSEDMRNQAHAWSLGAGGELGARIVDSLFLTATLQMTEFEAVALFGRLYIGNTDALIANLYNKYKYNAWRPYQAIRQTSTDPNWLPFLTTPVNQEYPCGHCMGTAGAMVPVMDSLGFDFFPTNGTVKLVSPGQRASPVFASFTEILHHVNIARQIGGMHFDFSVQKGSEYGTMIGHHVAKTMFQPRA
jgi:hypothetical protein